MKNVTIYLIFLVILSNKLFSQNRFPLEFAYGNSELDSFFIDNLYPVDYSTSVNTLTFNVEVAVDESGKIFYKKISQLSLEWEAGATPGLRKGIKDTLLVKLYKIIDFSEGLWLRGEENGIYIKDTLKKDIVVDYDAILSKHIENRFKNSAAFTVFFDFSKDYYNNGVKKLKQKKYFIAKEYFKEAIGLKKDYMDAYFNLGVTELRINNLPEACKAWHTAKGLGDQEVQGLLDKYCKE